MRIKIIILFGIVFCLILMFVNNCYFKRQSEVSQIKDLEFIFPESGVDTLHSKGEKLLSKRNDNGRYKFIIYSDSTNCSSCQMKTNGLWYSIIRDVRSKNIDMSFHFIYSPSSIDYLHINDLYLQSHFLYPIIVDKDGLFEKNNPFMRRKMLNSFIVNENNKVIFVGNPAQNIQDEERFIEFLNTLVI